MQQLILKTELEQSKIDALLQFLKSWDIDAELKATAPKNTKKRLNFLLPRVFGKTMTWMRQNFAKKLGK